MKNINTISMIGEKLYEIQTLINPNWIPAGQAWVFTWPAPLCLHVTSGPLGFGPGPGHWAVSISSWHQALS